MPDRSKVIAWSTSLGGGREVKQKKVVISQPPPLPIRPTMLDATVFAPTDTPGFERDAFC